MAVIVTGLSGNGYYINNNIIVSLDTDNAGAEVLFYNIRITDASNPQKFQEVKVYPKQGNSLSVNISPMLKSLFKKPNHNINYSGISQTNTFEKFNLRFESSFIVSGFPFSNILTINNKTFIRGGYRSNLQNRSSVIGRVLSPVETIPYWSGYPIAEYKIVSGFNIEKNPFADSFTSKELRYFKGCNPTYVKFLNSLGGYSYWLFEGLTNNTSTSNAGYSNNFGEVTDFGNTVNRSMQLYSKVPARFYPMILDLIESPEIYVYNNSIDSEKKDTFVRIINNNNSLSENDAKKSYEVKLNFEVVSNYNPEILW